MVVYLCMDGKYSRQVVQFMWEVLSVKNGPRYSVKAQKGEVPGSSHDRWILFLIFAVWQTSNGHDSCMGKNFHECKDSLALDPRKKFT